MVTHPPTHNRDKTCENQAKLKPPSSPKTIDQIYVKLVQLEALIVGNQSPWRTVTEAADYIGVSRRTIQRYLSNCILQSHKTPAGSIRLNKRDLDSWILFSKPHRKLTRPQKEQLNELCR